MKVGSIFLMVLKLYNVVGVVNSASSIPIALLTAVVAFVAHLLGV